MEYIAIVDLIQLKVACPYCGGKTYLSLKDGEHWEILSPKCYGCHNFFSTKALNESLTSFFIGDIENLVVNYPSNQKSNSETIPQNILDNSKEIIETLRTIYASCPEGHTIDILLDGVLITYSAPRVVN